MTPKPEDLPHRLYSTGPLCPTVTHHDGAIIKEHAMRVLLAFSIVCISCTSLAWAQRIATAPPSPVSIVKAMGLINVFSNRVDANFDGVLDQGDSPAAWVQIDPTSLQTLKSYSFPWADVKASFVGISETAKAAFFCIGNTVEKYGLESLMPEGVVYSGLCSAVSSTGGGAAIYVSQRPSFTDPGAVVQVTLDTRDSTVYQAGPNPQRTARFITSSNVQGLAVLSEGVFGRPNGLFDMYKQSPFGTARTSLSVGDTPNHFFILGDSAYVTVNGSHWVVIVDLSTAAAVDTIMVGTSGFDGPRESVVSNGKLYVSTFSSDVRVFDVASGTFIGKVVLNAKPEGIAINGTDLWVTRSYVAGGYSAERDVAVYDLNQAVSVDDQHVSPALPRALYVTSANVALPFNPDATIKLSALDGRTYAMKTVVSGSCTLDISSLPLGVYVATDGASVITLMR